MEPGVTRAMAGTRTTPTGVARRLATVARVLLAPVAGGVALRCATEEAHAPPRLEVLAPGFDYQAWFTDHTGLSVDSVGFGVHAMQPVAGTLYLGFGADLPVRRDGALLGAFDEQGLRAIAPLDEQGVLAMTVAGDALLVPGVDPCCPDGWEWGNFYLYRPAVGLVKRRNLPYVLHAWGAWYDAAEDAIYLAASAHPGDFLTSIGQIWRTGDGGTSWELVADGNDGVGTYRTYDVMGHQGWLIAVRRDESCTLVGRRPGGTTWDSLVPGRRIACLHRLASFAGRVIALDVGRGTLHVVPLAAASAEITVPFVVDSVAFNWATVAGGYLYVISDDGRVLATRDLVAWQTVLRSDRRFMTIQYWPDRDWLVLAGYSQHGAVWTLQLCGAAPC